MPKFKTYAGILGPVQHDDVQPASIVAVGSHLDSGHGGGWTRIGRAQHQVVLGNYVLKPAYVQPTVDDHVAAHFTIFVFGRRVTELHVDVVEPIAQDRDATTRPATTDQKTAGIVADVAFDDVVVHEGSRRTVSVHGIAMTAGHDAIGNRFDTLFVLRVDGVAMTPIWRVPAVVVNNAAVQFAVGRTALKTDTLGVIVDDQIDVLASRSGMDVQSTVGTIVALGMRTRFLEATGLREVF